MNINELAEVLASRGVMLGPDGRWTRVPSYSGVKPQLSQAQIEVLNASTHREQSEVRGKLQVQWMENFIDVVRVLDERAENAAWPFFGTFWIRLHGIIAELVPMQERQLNTLGIDATNNVPRPESVDYAIAVLAATRALRGALTVDERIYADYLRLTHAHPIQSSYEVSYDAKRDRIRATRFVASIGREFSIEERDAAIDRVLLTGRNEAAIAVAFARKIKPEAMALAQTLESRG